MLNRFQKTTNNVVNFGRFLSPVRKSCALYAQSIVGNYFGQTWRTVLQDFTSMN